MRRISDVRISPDWKDHCRMLLHHITFAPRFRNTLAQLYDNQETWETAAELGDTTTLMDAVVHPEVSRNAAEDAKSWMDGQDLERVEIQDLYAEELANLFQDTQDIAARYSGVAICVLQPSIRWIVEAYCVYLPTIKRSRPTFCLGRYGNDIAQAVQNWAEERTWGGSLSVQATELLVRPIGSPPFIVSHERLLEVANGTKDLPFKRTCNNSRRKPRLEDDIDLFWYTMGR